MNIGDKVIGKVIGINQLGVYVKIGSNIVFLSGGLSEQETIKNKRKEQYITDDGYIECPYTSGVECSVYLKSSCKNCGLSLK